MTEAKTLLTFIKRAKKFAHDNTYTKQLIVDGDTTVEDLQDVLHTAVGGLIAGIENDVSEIIDLLTKHYEKTGNIKMVEKLNKL